VRRRLLDQAHERVLNVVVLPAAGSALMHQRFSQDLLCFRNAIVSTHYNYTIEHVGGGRLRALGITPAGVVGARG
jgi:hypothetical protein